MKLLFLVCGLIGFFSGLYAQPNKNNDFQVWASGEAEKALGKKYAASVLTELRYGDDARLLYLAYVQLLLTYKYRDWLSFIPGYRQLWALNSISRNFDPIYEPLFAITLMGEKKGWKVADRNRIEYRIRKHFKPFFIYRNRITVITPWKISKGKVVPYFEDEWFWREAHGIDENRFIAGLRFPFNEQYMGLLYYLLRHENLTDTWRRQHVLGLRLTCKF